MTVMTPASWGEVIDKITILEIKSERLQGGPKLENVRKELALLVAIRERECRGDHRLAELTQQLKAANESLWTIEDDIRECERAKQFDATFIALARSVYLTNDRRAQLKRQINDLLGSELVEEKSYAPY
jgi:hypothetical protein